MSGRAVTKAPFERPTSEPNSWWTTLRNEGVVLSPLVLDDLLPKGPPEVSEWDFDQLRRAYQKFTEKPEARLSEWLDAVLDRFLYHRKAEWRKGPNVPAQYRTERGRAQRVLLVDEEGEDGPSRLLVLVDKDRVVKDDGSPGKIGVHSGRRVYAELVRLLQETNTPLGLLTNGHQFRLVHTSLDQARWVEWDVTAWFEGGDGRLALGGFRALLDHEALPKGKDPAKHDGPLAEAIHTSRSRQADLSHVMGHQVREAVEALLSELDHSLAPLPLDEHSEVERPLREAVGRAEGAPRSEQELQALYQAAIRYLMRLVVALYAESRQLLPVTHPTYLESYSVDGLYRTLREARLDEGEDALQHSFMGWPRLLALSRLIYHGSHHPDLPVPAYSGELYRPAQADPKDHVLAALAVFQHSKVRVSDATILRVLERLKEGRFKSGRKWITGPVDFGDLRTEYVGMMYEGLLDYDLREAREEDGGIVVLNLGEQPALPLRVLQHAAGDPKRLKKLVSELAKKSAGQVILEEPEEDEEELATEAEEAAKALEVAPESGNGAGEDTSDGDSQEEETGVDAFQAEVHAWALKVVQETGVHMPAQRVQKKWDKPRLLQEQHKAARKLVLRAVPPGGSYLVRWSGTRKGTGTFYTKPGLAVPTVRRTLEPLVYETDKTGQKIPKTPDEILKLKVCDPAMGSGNFLVGALRYLSQALRDSIELHAIEHLERGERVTHFGARAQGLLNERILPIIQGRNGDTMEGRDWSAQLDTQLRRSIMEHCIYGVDINPLAVELGKLSLWLETMDPSLPFSFIDHKIRCGNSLVGAWLHEYQHYPIAAWLREGGDGKNGERTKRIKRILRETIKPQLEVHIKRSVNKTLEVGLKRTDPVDLLEKKRTLFQRLHDAPTEEDRERLWREEILPNPNLLDLKHLMDRWCAIWFWPVGDDEASILDPETFYTVERDQDTAEIVERLQEDRRLRFFHWELEFPDVFSDNRWGFDAVVGNPPWETSKPNALEFFTRYRPEFRTYGKQESTRVQEDLFKAQPVIESEWHNHVEYYRSFSNYVSHTADPWEGLGQNKESKTLQATWAKNRGKSSRSTPYRYQGSADLNTYKLFTERFHSLLYEHARMGILIPAGLYSDYGTRDLRKLFLEQSQWEWVYSFENRRKLFPIDSRFKYAVNIIQCGGTTQTLKARFMVHTLDDWMKEGEPWHVQINREQIERFSPENLSLLEVQHPRDLEILDKIYRNSVLIKDLGVEYINEFHLTSNSNLWKPREWWEAQGFKKTELLCWTCPGGKRAVPLYVGATIHQFDFAYQSWHHVKYVPTPHTNKEINPKDLMDEEIFINHHTVEGPKIGFRDIARGTDKRTMIAALVPNVPCGNTLPIIKGPNLQIDTKLALLGALNSYVADFTLRFKISGTHLNWFYVQEVPIPREIMHFPPPKLIEKVAALNWHEDFFGTLNIPSLKHSGYVKGESDRAFLREEIDKLISKYYGLTDDDMHWILRANNSDPRSLWRDHQERCERMNSKDGWCTP